MNFISPLIGKLNTPGIITALKGNGRQVVVVTAVVQLLLLRDKIREALEKRGSGTAAHRKAVLKNLENDLKTIGLGMVLGKKRLLARVRTANELAKNL